MLKVTKQPGKPLIIVLGNTNLSVSIIGAGVACCLLSGTIWVIARLFAVYSR